MRSLLPKFLVWFQSIFFNKLISYFQKKIRFKDYSQALYLIFKIYKLDEVVKKESIKIVVTVDGANLTNHMSHATAGVKIMSKKEIMSTGYQSCNQCFPFMSILFRDSKQVYEKYVDEFFSWFNTVVVGPIGINGWMPLIVSSCQDMSSHWKYLKKGGVCRTRSKYFCHCCAKENERIAVPNSDPCEKFCIPLNETTWYHMDILHTEKINQLKEKKEQLEINYPHFSDIEKIHTDSCIHYSKTENNRFTYLTSILFVIHNDDYAGRISFNNFLIQDLQLRNISSTGNLSKRKNRLLEVLMTDTEYVTVCKTINYGMSGGGSVDLRKCIPCI